MSPALNVPSSIDDYLHYQDMTLDGRPGAVQAIYSTPQYSSSTDSTSVDSLDCTHRPLIPGLYVPTLAFFHQSSEDLDILTISRHAVRLAAAGVAGIATQGSNGEAVNLSRHERMVVTKTTRTALDEAGYLNMPIIVGCGSQSTRETIELCREACHAGGDYALVLPPSYYRPLFKQESIVEFFREVANASPIPILIYNFPGAASGVDLDSDTIIKLSKHSNIVGCKLTCGNTGKLARVASMTEATTLDDAGSGFMCMGGSVDFTLQTLIAGGSGIIGGLGNIAPKACVRLLDLYRAGKVKEAQKLQGVVAKGDWAAIQSGIVGTKSGLETHFGYGGFARRPLPRPTPDEAARYAREFKELVALEKTL